jgi:rhamnose transport system ATP-binding protein
VNEHLPSVGTIPTSLADPVLEAINIHKSFAGIRALKGVSVSLRVGQVHALVGENGAGKSTLVKILTGAIQADTGEVRLRGRPIQHRSPAQAREAGISVIYQEPALFPDLTVAENIFLAQRRTRPLQKVDWKALERRAVRLLDRVGARIRPGVLAEKLSMPQQQLVELAKTVDANAPVVIMDEPTASLGNLEAENLFRIIREMRAGGTAVIYISHRFEELFRLADRVTVLRDGQVVETRPMTEMTSEDLIRLMVGRELQSAYPKHDIQLGPVTLDVRNLRCKRAGLVEASLTVRRGEIVGLAGLVGSGRTQFAECLFGLTPIDSGEIYLDGGRLRANSPNEASRAGLAYVPEDRRRHGVILEMSVAANCTLASLARISKRGLLQPRLEQKAVLELIEQLHIKAPSVASPAKNLSGGNQQKVALARWLMTEPKVLILDEPTQGIDVGAKAEIYHLIGEFARRGLAILMISSDMQEILGLSDRVAVMAKGRIVGVLAREEAAPNLVLELALGHVTGAKVCGELSE